MSILDRPLLTVPNEGEELLLYLSIFPALVSVVLIKEKYEGQRPVYYINKVLLRAKNWYLRSKKLAYALIIMVRKLRHYFQAHPIIVLMDQPFTQILQWLDILGHLLRWSIELGELRIKNGYQSLSIGQLHR